MTGQYYQPPPPQYGMVPPEAESIKSLLRITGILSLIFGILLIIVGVIMLIIIIGIIWIILGIVDLLIYSNCKQINEMIDQRRYEDAKSKTMVWMIIGFIFGGLLPGLLMLIAYLKFDSLINQSRGMGYMPPPGQYAPPPPPQQRMCTGCGQQIPLNYNNCPHCGKHVSTQPGQQQGGMRTCMGCGQQIQANFKNCPHCGRQA